VQAYTSELTRGQATIYPRGWPHYQLNPDCKEKVVSSLAFNARDAGTYNIVPMIKAVPVTCECRLLAGMRPPAGAWPGGQGA
jgi:hypothetical protein